MGKNIDLEDLLRRVEALEHAVIGKGTAKAKKPKANAPSNAKKFEGATGGVRFLISEGFFNSRRTFAEVEKAMQDNGYHYSKQAVQMPLTRLSTVGGPLVALQDKGKNVYVKRK
jgi:hypothetical protein